MTINETLHSVTRDPTSFIDTQVLKQIISTLHKELPPPRVGNPNSPAWLTDDAEEGEHAAAKDDTVDTIRLAAALHRFVYTRSEYGENLEGGLNHSPTETLEKGGNCADQSLLLYALYREAGIEARITSTERSDGGEHHAFVECGFEIDPQRVIDVLSEYYNQTGLISSGRFHFFEADGMTYLIADPVAARFLGDQAGLDKMGYIRADGSMEINRRFTLYGEEKNPQPVAQD